MSDDDNVLFVRKSGETPCEDIWDDSVLIKAYDKAITVAKAEVAKRMGLLPENMPEASNKQKKSHSHKQQQQQSQKTQRKWCVGSPCRAVYSEDGELYEAVIIKIFENSGTCMVKYLGYNNKEKVALSTLLESEGLQAQIAQQKEALDHITNPMEFESTSKQNQYFENPMEFESDESKSCNNMFMPGSCDSTFGNTIPPAPPLPPQFMAQLPENDADALSSMLMSWYISGFHTGYYHGLKQERINQEKRRKGHI